MNRQNGRYARKNPVAHGVGVTAKELNYVTLRIAQPEQCVKNFGGTFGSEVARNG